MQGWAFRNIPSDRPDVNLLVRCALAFIPNHGAGVHYDIWFNIGAAIYSAQIDDGYEVFRAMVVAVEQIQRKASAGRSGDRHNGFRKHHPRHGRDADLSRRQV